VSSINRVLRNLAAQKEQQSTGSGSSSTSAGNSISAKVSVSIGGNVSNVASGSRGTLSSSTDLMQTATPLNSSESGGASNSGEGSEQEAIYEKLRLLNTQHAAGPGPLEPARAAPLVGQSPNHLGTRSSHPQLVHGNHQALQQHQQQSWPPRHYSGSWYPTSLSEIPISSAPNIASVTAYASGPSLAHSLSPPNDIESLASIGHQRNCPVATEDIHLKKGEVKTWNSKISCALMQLLHNIFVPKSRFIYKYT